MSYESLDPRMFTFAEKAKGLRVMVGESARWWVHVMRACQDGYAEPARFCGLRGMRERIALFAYQVPGTKGLLRRDALGMKLLW